MSRVDRSVRTQPPRARKGRRPRRSARGFTLIEVLLVLVILVILGSLVGIQVRGAQKKALVNAAKAQVSSFDTPLEMYQLDIGQYPTTEAGLEALRIAPADLENQTEWNGPYLTKNVPDDPWGNPYQYESPGKVNTDTYDIWTFGPDGQNGSEDDIGNWDRTL